MAKLFTAADVGWDRYLGFEGPKLAGRCPLVLGPRPTWSEKVMAVVSAHEGYLDSVQGYDGSPVVSVGLFQWTESPSLHVSNMLGMVHEQAPGAFAMLGEVMAGSGVTFERRDPGRWRFRKGSAWVESSHQLRAMYVAGASGRRGTWSAEQKAHGKAWVASLANVFGDPAAQRAQIAYTLSRYESFAFEGARRILWDGTAPENDGLHGAVRAAFLSFAVNRPTTASRQLEIGHAQSKHAKWSAAWAADVLRSIVFGSEISFWPTRYEKIRPHLERLFVVDLPDTSRELAGLPDDGLGTVRGIQQALVRLGFDPGPVDDRWGEKTDRAVRAYQVARRLQVDGKVGPKTRAALAADVSTIA